MLTEVTIAGLASYALYRGARWMFSQDGEHDAGFRRLIIRDAANLIGARKGISSDAVFDSLMEQRYDDRTRGVVRVECLTEKNDSGSYNCRIIVALCEGESVIAVSCMREFPWEDLPSQIRHDFIAHAQRPQTYILFDGKSTQ